MIARGYETLIVWRYLSSRKFDGFISLTALLSTTAIALSVGALIVVMAVMNGYTVTLIDKILGYHGHILVQGYGGEIDDYETLLKDLETLESSVSVTPYTESQVMVTRDGRAWAGLVRGLPNSLFTSDKLPVERVLSGNPAAAEDLGGVVLGYQLAQRLGVGAGGTITIVSPRPVESPFGSTLRFLEFPVAAVVEIGVFQFDESFIGMPLTQAQRFFRMQGKVTNIEIFLEDPNSVDQVMDLYTATVGNRAIARSWRSFNQALVGALQTERVVMFLILSLFILVAVFNVASSLYMLVKDKAGDIAILRTLGVSRAGIRRIFVTVGLAVGLLGIIAGGILATLFILNIEAIKSGIESLLGLNLWDPSVRFISEMKAIAEPTEVYLTIGVAVLLTFLATLLPASRAARLDPVDVLRAEG